jgi:hypothetical protein
MNCNPYDLVCIVLALGQGLRAHEPVPGRRG